MSDPVSTNTSERSFTLSRLGLSPSTACAACRHAIWQGIPAAEGGVDITVRIYCRLMHVLIEDDLELCDGQAIE